MKIWFGVVTQSTIDEDMDNHKKSITVCYCGAGLVPLDYDLDKEIIKVAGVWHLKDVREAASHAKRLS